MKFLNLNLLALSASFILFQVQVQGAEIHNAVRNGDFQTVKSLLQNPYIDVNEKDDYKKTALHLATEFGYENIVEIILKHPFIEMSGDEKITWMRDNDIKNMILGKKQVFELHQHVKDGNLEAVSNILSKSDVNVNDKINGKTALHLATEKNDEKIAKALIYHPKINVNEKDFYYNQTALHWASEEGYGKIVALLLKRSDINVNEKDSLGYTAIDLAKTDVIKAKIRAKNDPKKDININIETQTDHFNYAGPFYLSMQG